LRIEPVLACQHTDAEAAEPGGRSILAAPLNPLPKDRGPVVEYMPPAERDNGAMTHARTPLADLLLAVDNASRADARPRPARLLAVSKTRGADEIAMLADAGQRAFGENYVQEALPKIEALRGRGLEWHLIGHLQSNKADAAARAFDWVQSVDRPKLVAALAKHRPDGLPPLDVLIQVNIDDEASKHGCRPEDVDALADAIAAQPRLRLRGLMAIPAPTPDPAGRRAAFRAMRRLFDALQVRYTGIDTLSMGMSEDFVPAIEEGATMVRVGSALFGARAEKSKGSAGAPPAKP
jgi:pyridoxal phosphate enzyme (YggS family)